MSEWWSEPLRAITLEFPASDVSTIDVAGIVDEVAQGGANTICVFTIGYYPGGTSFYQSDIAPHYPELGERDLLAEAIEAARENDQKVIAYVASIWGNADMFEAHPDWAQRKADGSVTSWDEAYNSVAMCPNSPFRAYLASVVREIADGYDVDGFYFDEPSFQSWCSCEHCREGFGTAYGEELPTEERWDDPVFQSFIDWRHEQIAEWRQDLYDLTKNDRRCVFFQGAFPLATLPAEDIELHGLAFPHPYQERFGVSWHVPLAHGAPLAQSAQVGDVVHFELYRRSVNEPLWWYGVSLRYGQTIGQGKQILTLNMMAQTPFDVYGLPEAELRLSIAEIVANGGAPLFARYYPDRVDQEAWDQVYQCLTETQTLDPYIIDRQSIKYAAVLFSDSTLERFDQVPGKPAHLDCLKGFAKSLLQEQILFDVITESDLATGLESYDVLILPNTSCLSSDAKQAVRTFVADGGSLLASYEAGMYDERGRRTPDDDFSDLFGVTYGEPLPPFMGFDVYMKLDPAPVLDTGIPSRKMVPTGGTQVAAVPGEGVVAAELLGGAEVMYGPVGGETGLAAVVTREVDGGGRVVYFAPSLGSSYLRFGVPAHRRLITSAVGWAANSRAPVRVADAPASVALTAYRQPEQGRTVVHLVNSVRDEVMPPITEVSAIRGVTLEVEAPEKPEDVFSPGGDAGLARTYEDGVVTVTLSSLTYHTVVVIQY